MPDPKVLIIGCGVAGPVAANFYKRKGYDPIIFEKVARLGDAGASLMLMPNGMNVLNLVGLANTVATELEPLHSFVERTATGELLAESELPSSFAAKYGQPAVGIKRTTLNLMLKDMLLNLGVEVREGWKLVDIRETEDDVTAIFDNGQSVTGSFLVGCDGIRSTTRQVLQRRLGILQRPPEYTGLVQMAGISKTPASLLDTPAMRNWYGQGNHVIAYPVSKTHISWAATMREAQEEETWRLYSPEEIKTQTAALATRLDGWEPVIRDMVLSAERIVKFGLFDREELRSDQWYSQRCVLIGDAAHPTSPHLGQGANQALEDCYHLCHSMPFLDPQSDEFEKSIATFGPQLSDTYFRPLAEKRQPRTSSLVKAAREVGELRTTNDSEKCRQRDDAITLHWQDVEKVDAKYRALLTATFPALT
ncbi:3-hydroxybenzoate 6-hydroxylase-like protein [Cladobotryum mycophilum]|uniref:3-hydroxybenzoate 6-hydroxylase-like protein n=1 Tax=Cladobotryum mycophilum TaxID=491253 RepID=A0ABR0SNT9_9HYPO